MAGNTGRQETHHCQILIKPYACISIDSLNLKNTPGFKEYVNGQLDHRVALHDLVSDDDHRLSWVHLGLLVRSELCCVLKPEAEVGGGGRRPREGASVGAVPSPEKPCGLHVIATLNLSSNAPFCACLPHATAGPHLPSSPR